MIPDVTLRRLSDLHDALACVDDAFEAETRLAFVAERIGAGPGRPLAEDHGFPGPDLAEQLARFLDAHLFEPVTMAGRGPARPGRPSSPARSPTPSGSPRMPM